MRRVLLLLTAMGGFSFAQPAYAQSYDCRLVHRADEIAVCRDERLARLDERANSLYRRLRGELGPGRAGRLDADRRGWLQQRARCGPDPYCLEQVYRQWIDHLRDRRRY